MITKPYVTVLMPVYNGEKYLKEAIESILAQTYSNFEFLIINDGSIDASEEIILSYNDQRIRYIKNERNLKLIATLNKGLELSKGEFIVRLDADDIAREDRIEKQLNFLMSHEDYGLVGSWCKVINSDKKITYHVDHEDLIFAMALYCPFIHPSIMIRKSILIENQLKFSENFLHAEDYELWSRIILITKVANIPDFFTFYREHEAQISTRFETEQIQKANTIKINYLNKIQIKFNVNLLPLFKLAPFEKEDSMSIALYLSEIFDLNNINKIFGTKSFKRFLIREFKNVLLERGINRKVDRFKIIKLQIFKESKFTLKQKIRLIVKPN
jgi:glycosyltransferase involved in cell wall biosynthesis